MPKRLASLLLHNKVLLKSGVIVESKIWRVVGDSRYQEGLKYSLFAVRGGEIIVGYDNHHPKGHHRHIGDSESVYNFTTLEKLKNDFKADLEVELAGRGLE
jgi:hypothetical protein